MGHERIGALPRNLKWQEVLQLLSDYTGSEAEVKRIADATLSNVRDRFRYIENDPGVQAAYQFLIGLSIAAGSDNPQKLMAEYGMDLPSEPSALSLASTAREWINANQSTGSREYATLAFSAVADTLVQWVRSHKYVQGALFRSDVSGYEQWRTAGTGAGFSELSRAFFGNFTDRYLNYFLEREASSSIGSLGDRDRLAEQISKHSDETAKIVQSFAAGWFTKNTRERLPPKDAVRGFLHVAFGKLREELEREGRST